MGSSGCAHGLLPFCETTLKLRLACDEVVGRVVAALRVPSGYVSGTEQVPAGGDAELLRKVHVARLERGRSQGEIFGRDQDERRGDDPAPSPAHISRQLATALAAHVPSA